VELLSILLCKWPQLLALIAMDSVILIISDRDYTNRSRKEMKKGGGGLRLVHSLTEFGVSSCPRAPAGIQSPKGKGGEVGTTTYGLVRPNSQATAQKHNRCPICLGGYVLRLGTTPKGLTEAGVRSGWLARRCCGWELAREGRGMIHTVLRSEVRRAEVSERARAGRWDSYRARRGAITYVYNRDVK